MRTKTVRTVMDYVHGEFEGDKTPQWGVSLTVPDMTMSLKELVDRHTRGLEVPQYQPVYNGYELIPDHRMMDLEEVNQLKKSLQSEISEHEENLKIAKDNARKAKDADYARLKKMEEEQTKSQSNVKKSDGASAPNELNL